MDRNQNPGWNVWHIAAVLLLTMVAHDIWQSFKAVEPMPYSEFMQQLEAGNVADMQVSADRIQGSLKRPLQDGETVPITLTVEAKDGTRSTVQLEAPVRGVAAQGGGHGHMNKH